MTFYRAKNYVTETIQGDSKDRQRGFDGSQRAPKETLEAEGPIGARLFLALFFTLTPGIAPAFFCM